MQIKRFEAKNMTMALRLIKDELGPEAVILSARSLREGKGFFGSMKYAGVEVTAAIDNLRLPMGNSTAVGRIDVEKNWEKLQLKDAYRMERKKIIRPTGYNGKIADQRQSHHAGIKRNLDGDHKAFSSLYQTILAQEVDRSIVTELIEKIKHTPAARGKIGIEDLRFHCPSILEELGVVVDADAFDIGNHRFVAFAGCSGVGKTTTVAKLAAVQARRYNKRVALITIDNYGIAAIKQLKTYAQIIGIPIENPVNIGEMKRSIKNHKDKELIIIDTPGINPNNYKMIQHLKDHFAGLSDLQIHLVLSAATKEKDLINTTDAFKEIRINRLLFTKIDESCTYGNIINLLIRTNIPLSFLCGGRKVPDDIEAGSTEKLVELLFKSHSANIREMAVSAHTLEYPSNDLDKLPVVRTNSVAN